jgi:outer membrane protein OmpA-like peptidoglycan-associated protein/tetratricopeptide (TPR) repeat protein
MKRSYLIFFFLGIVFLTKAQSTNISTLFQSNFKKAEYMYSRLAYRNALELYLVVNEKDSTNYPARQRIADCYFRLGEVDEAEQWYAALAQVPAVPPVYKYKYAQVLSIQGKYADAQKWFFEYATLTSDPRATSNSEFIYFISYYFRDSVLYDIQHAPFNSDQSDFAPQYHNDGLVFVSARDRDLFVKRQSVSALNEKEAMLNIFYAPKEATTTDDAVFFYHQDINSPYHDGPITFYDQGKRVAFSRNNLKDGKPVHHDGKVHLKLYFAQLDKENTIRNIESFPFNNDTYSVGHPWISDNGNVLYFASDSPGGEGGVDLYRSIKDDGKWSTPHNLGPNLNTMGDELYPFMANDSTLYFSSNGHGGLGGIDIYVSRSTDKGKTFGRPENLGFPLNTSSDDFSLVMDPGGRKGLFSSNREGGDGYDDIYSFEVKSFFVVGKTVNRNDSAKAVPSASIAIRNEQGILVHEAVSDAQGYFHADLSFDHDYQFSASKDGYTWLDTLKYSTNTRSLGRDSIIIPLWKHTMFAKGLVYSNETQDKLSQVVVMLQNLTDGRIDSVITSSTGSYNFLVMPDKKYKITAQKEGFISSGFELNTKGLFDGELLNDFLLEEVFNKKVVLQFDFDKWKIRSEFDPQLEEVVRAMTKNRKLHIHIGAYADARGTAEYNLRLSNNRANEVVNYLVSHGIDRQRITAIGFGEELILNHCSNGVICTDVEHSKNRRAELKVQLVK